MTSVPLLLAIIEQAAEKYDGQIPKERFHFLSVLVIRLSTVWLEMEAAYRVIISMNQWLLFASSVRLCSSFPKSINPTIVKDRGCIS